MNVRLNITYSVTNREQQMIFIRKRSAAMPTDAGAARMIAKEINDQREDGGKLRERDVSIHRMETMLIAS